MQKLAVAFLHDCMGPSVGASTDRTLHTLPRQILKVHVRFKAHRKCSSVLSSKHEEERSYL